jgi:hypothetical protein
VSRVGKSKKSPPRPTAKTGPKPDMLKLSGNWKQAVKKSLTKKKPPEGWPK